MKSIQEATVREGITKAKFGTNLDDIHGWDTDESKYEYWAIIDVVEGLTDDV